MIKLININKYYQSASERFHALKDVNLTFDEQGMTFILGKSGSGKSTLLNIIGGLDKYDSGQLIIDNTDTRQYNSRHYNTYRNTYVGFVFQEFNVLKGLSVWDNIALSIKLQHANIRKPETRKQIQDIIDKVGLTGLEKRMMNQISGGQRQRVAIARALIKNPRVIIADEPTGNLDGKNSKMIMDLLKELSKEHLIIIVTHSDALAKTYADRIIGIKDGVTHDVVASSLNTDDKPLNEIPSITPIKVPLSTSFYLGVKSFVRNKIRFIVMILLFALALTFAGVVVNLSSVDTALIYANYQEDYGSFGVNISKKYTSYNITTTSAFFAYEIENVTLDYADGSPYLQLLKGMDYYIPLNLNNTPADPFYVDTIQRVHIYDSEFFQNYSLVAGSYNNVRSTLNSTIISDYLAETLIHFNYFDGVTTLSQLINQEITAPNFKKSLKIVGIFKTNYENFKPYFNSEEPDTKYTAAFEDNLIFYSSLFVNSDTGSQSGSTYEQLYSPNNITYFYDNVIYNALDKVGISDIPVRFAHYNEVYHNGFTTATNGKEPKPNNPGEPVQMAISTGYFEKILGITLNASDLVDSEGNEISKTDAYFNKVYFKKAILQADGSYKEENLYANNAIVGISRVPLSLTFQVVTVVDNDEPAVYAPSNGLIFERILSSSYGMGSFITIINTGSTSTPDSAPLNAKVFDDMINNDMIINNKSFVKILLVHDFIENNLWLFFGIFFVFGLFSILLIFNFVIVSIKNSTRDIGIYMSLGMSGLKIAAIYFFQILLMGIISFTIAAVSMSVFLLVLDANFTALASVNLPIIKITLLGVASILGISVIIPNLAIVVPLFNLSRKHPIDVIKSA